MKRYPNFFVEQVREMATDNKLSYRDISRRLGVDSSLASKWCIGASKNATPLRQMYSLRRARILDSEKIIVADNNFNVDNNKLYCALIYGCEGAKYPASNVVSFVNSDPNLIKSFTHLMRRSFSLSENKWRIHLQIHDDQDFIKLRKFWSSWLNIPESQFYKPTITAKSIKKHNRNYQGTCSVRYGDYKIQLKLIGIFNEFLRKSVLLEDMPIG